MDILYGILLIGTVILSIVSLVSYFSNRGRAKKSHAEVLAELKPARQADYSDVERFKEVYKKDLTHGTPVFTYQGAVEYIGIEVNHAEQREYSIGDIRIHNASVHRMGKKDIGLHLADHLPETEKFNAAISELKERSEAQKMSDEQVGVEVEELLNKYCLHSFDFVFLKDDFGNQAAYIIAFDNWKM